MLNITQDRGRDLFWLFRKHRVPCLGNLDDRDPIRSRYSPGRGMPRSLKMRFATGRTISAWRGTALVSLLAGFQ